MEAFIKKQEYNYIKKCLIDLNNALTNCNDKSVLEATKCYTQTKIINNFENLSHEEEAFLDISKITQSMDVDIFLNGIEKYVTL